MILQVLIDGPEQSSGEWAGFAVITLALACVPWIWRWSKRRRGQSVELRQAIVPSVAFLAFAALALFEALARR